MFLTNRVENRPRVLPDVIVAIVGLMGVASMLRGPSRPAFAQATGPSWTYTGNLNAARSGHTAILLPNGKVLVAGGGGSGQVTSSAELYDPATGVWNSTGTPNTTLGSTATLLPNGKILVVGGGSDNKSAELYDPATGTWSNTGNLNERRRDGQTATLLPNGKVLVAGGFIGDFFGAVTNSAELYDAATGIWRITGNLRDSRGHHTATLLPSGKVLVAGGYGTTRTLNSAELYYPAAGMWSTVGSLNTDRGFHTATLLPNGTVLVAGGTMDDGNAFPSLNSAELYNPFTETWSNTGNLNTAREYAFTATLLPSGKVLIAGGTSFGQLLNKNAELYDPTIGTWSNTGHLNTERFLHTATLLPNGQVLVAGGSDENTTLSSVELYDPGTSPNQIDDTQFFVRQHYRDFLNREPDAEGLAFWTNEINLCGGEAQCVEVKRINDSASFFLSIEFQETGYLVYRFYKASYGNLPGTPVPIKLNEFLPDTTQIGQGVIVNQAGWETALENNKQAFSAEFVQRSRFTSAFPTSMTPDAFVDTLFTNAGLVPSSGERATAIAEFGSASNTADVAARARALRRVTENATLAQQEFNRAFVLMQYFGYLRRNPNDVPEATLDFQGYNFWLNKLNSFNGNSIQAEMVKAFLSSSEYRRRFGP